MNFYWKHPSEITESGIYLLSRTDDDSKKYTSIEVVCEKVGRQQNTFYEKVDFEVHGKPTPIQYWDDEVRVFGPIPAPV